MLPLGQGPFYGRASCRRGHLAIPSGRWSPNPQDARSRVADVARTATVMKLRRCSYEAGQVVCRKIEAIAVVAASETRSGDVRAITHRVTAR